MQYVCHHYWHKDVFFSTTLKTYDLSDSRNYEDIELLDISSICSTYKEPNSKIRKMSNKLEFDDETDENDDLTDPFV